MHLLFVCLLNVECCIITLFIHNIINSLSAGNFTDQRAECYTGSMGRENMPSFMSVLYMLRSFIRDKKNHFHYEYKKDLTKMKK